MNNIIEETKKLCADIDEAYINEWPNTEGKIQHIAKTGKKYIKIIRCNENQRCVWGFVNIENGDILKASSWNSPAKHPRGNIYDNYQINGMRIYGPDYLR